MIEELRIQGYRSLRDVTWRPGKLNVLIGPNGGGKSNLLHAMSLLRLAGAGGFREEVLRRGGMPALLWDGSARSMEFRLCARTVSDTPSSYWLRLDSFENIGDYFLAGDFFNGIESPIPSSERMGAQPHLFRAQGEGTFMAKYLEDWSVYHDIRTDQAASIRQPVVTRYDRHVESDGQNLVSLLHTLYANSRFFEDAMDRAMGAAFIDDYEKLVFAPASDGRISLRMRRKKSQKLHSMGDLSDGTIRFLFLAAELSDPTPPRLIAIDEPELGLHPRMLAIVAELATSASDRTQVVLSTHSAQLLNCFKDEIPTTTVVTWDGKETHLNTFSADQLKDWLADFSLGEFSFSGTAEALG